MASLQFMVPVERSYACVAHLKVVTEDVVGHLVSRATAHFRTIPLFSVQVLNLPNRVQPSFIDFSLASHILNQLLYLYFFLSNFHFLLFLVLLDKSLPITPYHHLLFPLSNPVHKRITQHGESLTTLLSRRNEHLHFDVYARYYG